MGNIGSRPDDGSALYLKDQSRFSLLSLSVTSSRHRPLVHISPNGFPATKVVAKREAGDDSPVEFIQDAESTTGPAFLLRLNNDEELHFNFSMIIRQPPNTNSGQAALDTVINGLTFVFASNLKELDVLVTREFHADPNLHKNSNVELVGSEYSTSGAPSTQLDWTWKWRPPKAAEDRGGGWRNTCTFVEYDQRAHRLNTLATFSFYVQGMKKGLGSPTLSPQYELLAPPRFRVVSSQSAHSAQSALSDSEGPAELNLPSPHADTEGMAPFQQAVQETHVVDVSCPRPGEDMSAVEDGPLFRATMKALEQKTGNMKARMKKVLRKAEAAQAAQAACNEAVTQFMDALQEASKSNANAVQPALEHYFEKIAREILNYEHQNTTNLQKLIIDPLSRLYNYDIKQAESKKRDFEDESKDYYAYVGRYLGQRQDSLKEKKRIDSDSKYQSKRRTFELKRFDYSSFMQDLHGGRKEQEVLSHLTRFADTQAKSYLATAKKVEEMVPQLDALIKEVGEADKEFQYQRTEREEKRRNLEKSTKPYIEPESNGSIASSATAIGHTGDNNTDTEMARSDSNQRHSLHYSTSGASQAGTQMSSSVESNTLGPSTSIRSVGASPMSSPGQDKFRGIRDLDGRIQSTNYNANQPSSQQQRKEGLLWALSRPGSHVDPRGLNKQAWHKFWIVLDQGKLSEYSNWKERLDLHMEPIDLRLASVREARNAERRFCFEVITPAYKRVYQATSEEDMTNWINAINNALQGAFEGQTKPPHFSPTESSNTTSSLRRDIGSILTGKSPSHHSHLHHSHSQSTSSSNNVNSSVSRRTTVGARPSYIRTESGSYNDNPTRLLQEIRERDQGNKFCADCNSNVKTEWCSINLGIVLCIECSGIHRSLGTHISKIRSLTLDTVSFTADIVEIIMQIGNRLSNAVWEAKFEPRLKPHPSASRDQRLRFITDKYVGRLYVQPISPTLSAFSTPDELLLASVKKNDITQVLYAIALRANPNAVDRSRGTHVLFLAVAAADPAMPGTPSASSKTTPTQANTRLPAFPIAELLLQNGGELPTTPPAFPLSIAAKEFVEQRSTKDQLSALPSFKPSSNAGNATEKQQEKAQKRSSGSNIFGGRNLANLAGLTGAGTGSGS